MIIQIYVTHVLITVYGLTDTASDPITAFQRILVGVSVWQAVL